jgi:hypothetical protein
MICKLVTIQIANYGKGIMIKLIAITLLMVLTTNSLTLATTTNARDEQTGDCLIEGKCRD